MHEFLEAEGKAKELLLKALEANPDNKRFRDKLSVLEG